MSICASAIASSRSRAPIAFAIDTNRGNFTAPALVIATGGLSIPKIGRDRLRLRRRRAASACALIEPRPGWSRSSWPATRSVCASRCPAFRLTRWSHAAAKASAKISCSPIAACQVRRSFRFPRTGEGRHALDRPGAGRWTPQSFLRGSQTHPSQSRAEKRSGGDPARPPCTCFGGDASSPGQSIANLPDRSLAAIAAAAQALGVRPTDSEGWAKAEVTVGGIDTAGLSSKTMEAREVPGLYRSVRRSTSPAGWAATISSGRGRAAGAPARRCNESPPDRGRTGSFPSNERIALGQFPGYFRSES